MKVLTMRTIVFIGFLSCALLFSGCDSGGSNDSFEQNITGTYALQTVDGVALPFVVVQVMDNKIELLEGQMRLDADQTFSASLTARITEDGVATTETESDTGTYSVSGTTLTLTYGDGTTESGTLVGKTMTITAEEITFVFRK